MVLDYVTNSSCWIKCAVRLKSKRQDNGSFVLKMASLMLTLLNLPAAFCAVSEMQTQFRKVTPPNGCGGQRRRRSWRERTQTGWSLCNGWINNAGRYVRQRLVSISGRLRLFHQRHANEEVVVTCCDSPEHGKSSLSQGSQATSCHWLPWQQHPGFFVASLSCWACCILTGSMK